MKGGILGNGKDVVFVSFANKLFPFKIILIGTVTVQYVRMYISKLSYASIAANNDRLVPVLKLVCACALSPKFVFRGVEIQSSCGMRDKNGLSEGRYHA